LLEGRRTITWREALGPNPTIVDFLSTLLALLELARRGELALTQPTPFAPPEISRDAALPAD
jgi:chromatin segregation and condensation protein Rec8/ScpA/Scc1 (kleisin family)